MTSKKCIDGNFWDSTRHDCQPCETKYHKQAGSEFTENCGWSDEQHQVGVSHTTCRDGTFNDGSHIKCQKCHSCLTTQFIACNSTTDTICCKQGEQVFSGKCIPQQLPTKTVMRKTSTITDSVSNSSRPASPTPHQILPQTPSQKPSLTSSQTIQNSSSAIDLTGIYVFLGILSTLTLLCLFLVIKRRRTKHFNEEFQQCCNGADQESLSKKERYEQTISYNIIKEIDNDHMTGSAYLLAPEVQGKPLKTVLNNLDVLEELVLVLDPDISGAKNTRHLAAQCSFSFAWINYAYSMKDHKSPLVAVLEGVVTKNPDWTVGHLAELLTTIGRNDAVEILAKLPAGVEE
ncbi:IGF-like family receptor 1 isoform X2 [Chanodichthys erythropterus]|uniref:IGF-like family receptor 1 isoform X2 n=1 Tax=Chanodichthys erythropterus TaxID=933992 RepID=UPI00351F7A4C